MIGKYFSWHSTYYRIFRYILIHVCISTNKSIIANSYPADNYGTSPYYHIITNGRTPPILPTTSISEGYIMEDIAVFTNLDTTNNNTTKMFKLKPFSNFCTKRKLDTRLPTDMLIIKREHTLSHRNLRQDMKPLMIQPM